VASRNELSPGARIAIGAAMLALGIAVTAVGAQTLLADPEGLSSEGLVGVPIGMVFAFGGLLLAVPPRYARLRAAAAAVLVTAMALTADWVAFGPGERRFGAHVGAGIVGVHGRASETLGRTVFGVGAVILDLFAVLLWVRGFRRHWKDEESGNVPRDPG
jgi:hypothetical protein